MNKILTASLEAIDFQRNSTLIKELGMQFDACMKSPTTETFKQAKAALEKITTKHTGMKIRFNFVRGLGHNAFVITPRADSANPMTADRVVERVRRTGRPMSEQELFKGIVDIKTGKVSGIYSEIPVDVFISVDFFNGSITGGFRGDHVAAFATHEIGHAFTYLRYLGQMVISNVVVAEIARRRHEGADDKVIQEVVRVAEQKTGYRLRDMGTINAGTEPLVIQQVVMAAMVDKIRSELGTKFYDRRAFEFSADQFVARHGGASLLVEAIDYVYKQYPEYVREYRGRVSNIMASLYDYGTVLTKALIGAAGIFGITIGATGIGITFLLIGLLGVLTNMFGEPDQGIYDPIPKRYEAMRRELIASSKEQALSIAQRQEIIRQIQIIDDIISKLSDKYFFGPEIIGEWIVGVFTGRAAEQKFQRKLEELVNNRLFEMSNQLQAKMV